MGMAFFCFQENPIKKLPSLRGTKQSQTIQSGPAYWGLLRTSQ